MHKSQKMESHGGEQNRALNAFGKYQQQRLIGTPAILSTIDWKLSLTHFMFKELGAESDDNPKHWDAALMISGYNFWTVPKRGKSKGKKVTAAMGLAAVDGMCDPRGRYLQCLPCDQNV